jgi:hypothetical protein
MQRSSGKSHSHFGRINLIVDAYPIGVWLHIPGALSGGEGGTRTYLAQLAGATIAPSDESDVLQLVTYALRLQCLSSEKKGPLKLAPTPSSSPSCESI